MSDTSFLPTALEFARANRNGVLVTIKRDGRPQSSNITHHVDDDGVVRISMTAGRAKYANLQRDARLSLHVSADNFWAYVVLEGDAEFAPVAQSVHDATCDELVELYRAIAGEHPDWNEYRQAMVDDQRTILQFRPSHAYGMLS